MNETHDLESCREHRGPHEIAQQLLDEAMAKSYAVAAGREAQRQLREYEQECARCIRCGGLAYHGICDCRNCQAVGIATGTQSPAEKAAHVCPLCGVLAGSFDAIEWGWYPGYWERSLREQGVQEIWRGPCCEQCGSDLAYDLDLGEYVHDLTGGLTGIPSGDPAKEK